MNLDRDDALFFKANRTNIRVRRPRTGELREILDRSGDSPAQNARAFEALGPTLGAPSGFEWRVVVVRIAPGHHARMIVTQRVDAPEEIDLGGEFTPIPIAFGKRLAIDQQKG